MYEKSFEEEDWEAITKYTIIYWFVLGSRPYKIFAEIVSSLHLIRDLAKLSHIYQTYSLEVFHCVVNRFALESTHYFHASMIAR